MNNSTGENMKMCHYSNEGIFMKNRPSTMNFCSVKSVENHNNIYEDMKIQSHQTCHSKRWFSFARWIHIIQYKWSNNNANINLNSISQLWIWIPFPFPHRNHRLQMSIWILTIRDSLRTNVRACEKNRFCQNVYIIYIQYLANAEYLHIYLVKPRNNTSCPLKRG